VGNRQINRALHIMAVVQFRHRGSEGRACYERKVAAGKTRWKPCDAQAQIPGIDCHQMIRDHRVQSAGWLVRPGRGAG
jgi:hypothetical protein